MKKNKIESKSNKKKILRDIERVRTNSRIYRKIAKRDQVRDNIEKKYEHKKIMFVNLFEDFK